MNGICSRIATEAKVRSKALNILAWRASVLWKAEVASTTLASLASVSAPVHDGVWNLTLAER